jgi:TolB-like protein/cytochrome c-type biogenesis protein CcmH/NrfG
MEVQGALSALNADLAASRRMEFRIGIHLGDVRVERERIYGDGVNIAARLEGLAEAGGICISGAVRDQIRNKLDCGYEDLGAQEVKNIPEPVRVYRVRAKSAPGAPAVETSRSRQIGFVVSLVVALAVFGVAIWNFYPERRAGIPESERPSLAVLPFTNMSGDPEQEYFSDGITEDLITDLSKISGLVVIARNSVFTYKGRAVKVDEVGRELGVRYVLEGSVRKVGDRVRITAQLVEASNGHHLWAERYDRQLEDIFDLQDQVTGEIVAALHVTLTEGERQSTAAVPTESLEAYDYFMRGSQLMTGSNEGFVRAREMFERAIELDPGFGAAHAALGYTHLSLFLGQWTEDPAERERAVELARKGVALAPSDPIAHRYLSMAYVFTGRQEEAMAEAERAIQLNPNDASAYGSLGRALLMSGRSHEAIEPLEKAARLDPRDWIVSLNLGQAYYLTEHYDRAVPLLRQAVNSRPDIIPTRISLAVLYSELGETEKARKEVAEVLRINPRYSVEGLRKRLSWVDPDRMERIVEALNRVGLD